MASELPQRKAPIGHSLAAHRVHGWCSHCPDHTVEAEITAWRVHENEQHEQYASPEPFSAPHISADQTWETCPACREPEVLAVARVTAHTEHGSHEAGGWSLCLNCGAVPGYPLTGASHG